MRNVFSVLFYGSIWVVLLSGIVLVAVACWLVLSNTVHMVSIVLVFCIYLFCCRLIDALLGVIASCARYLFFGVFCIG